MQRAERDRLFYHHVGLLLFIWWWLEAAAFFGAAWVQAHACVVVR